MENHSCLGGKIKVFPEDFVVEEVWNNQVCRIHYSFVERIRDTLIAKLRKRQDYLRFTLVKQDWETSRALRYIGKRIHVSLKRFGIAGMKDKRAITAQRVSLWRGDVKALARLRLHDIVLKDFEYADERINLGDATGNRFVITIRDVPLTQREIVCILNRFKEKLATEGIPNYYGPQRLSGGNVKVGHAIKDGDLKLAVELILQKIAPYLNGDSIDTIPKVFWYEKKMVHRLKKYPRDYAGALRQIPKRIRKLYLHAYQSQIFNHKLEQAFLERKIPPNLTVGGFSVPSMPELSTVPISRQCLIKPKNFQVLRVKNGVVTLSFTLAKGEYASTLLSFLIQRKPNQGYF